MSYERVPENVLSSERVPENVLSSERVPENVLSSERVPENVLSSERVPFPERVRSGREQNIMLLLSSILYCDV